MISPGIEPPPKLASQPPQKQIPSQSCCALGCTNTVPGMPDARGNPITFHRFPRKNDKILNRWIEFCGPRTPSIVDFPNDESRICSAHFPTYLFRSFVRDGRLMRALHPQGLPSIEAKELMRGDQAVDLKCVVNKCPTVGPLFLFPDDKM